MTGRRILNLAGSGLVILVAAGLYFWPLIAPAGETVVNVELKLGFEAARKTVWPAGPLRECWSSSHQLDLAAEGGGLALLASGTDPYLVSKPFPRLEPGPHLLRVVIAVPLDTHLQVFFYRLDRPEPAEADSVMIAVVKGRNEVFLSLPHPETLSGLRLDVGDFPGRYVLQEISIRQL